jgi:hypothetical protein
MTEFGGLNRGAGAHLLPFARLERGVSEGAPSDTTLYRGCVVADHKLCLNPGGRGLPTNPGDLVSSRLKGGHFRHLALFPHIVVAAIRVKNGQMEAILELALDS